MVAVDFLEEFVRVATSTESFWGWVLVVGTSVLVLALLWMMVQTAHPATGWKRGLYWLLLLIPCLLAGTTAFLIYAKREDSAPAARGVTGPASPANSPTNCSGATASTSSGG